MQNDQLYPGRSRQLIVALIISVLLLFLVYSVKEFIAAFLGALIFYVLFRKLMIYFITVKNWKRWMASLLIIVISFLVIVVPATGLVFILFDKLQNILNSPQAVILGYHTLVTKVNDVFGRQLIDDNSIYEFTGKFASAIPTILNSTLQLFGSLLMMYFLLYYLLMNTGKFEKKVFDLLPFSKAGIGLLTTELHSITRANAIAVPLIALCQGLVASFGFFIFGLNDPLFWGIMCGCTSILPVIGAGLIWVPAGIYLLSTAESWHGIGVLGYGVFIISTVDNIFRFFFAKWFADVHPIITILGVIIGLKWFGLPGLVFGPLLIAYFFILIKIYKTEFITSVKRH